MKYPEFEWYDSRFSKDSDESELDLYIPIQEKLKKKNF